MTHKPTPDTIAEIAGRLGRPKRAALLRAEEDGNLGHYFVRWWHANSRTLRALKRDGLGFQVWSGICLTPLGLQVKDHLEQAHEPR